MNDQASEDSKMEPPDRDFRLKDTEPPKSGPPRIFKAASLNKQVPSRRFFIQALAGGTAAIVTQSLMSGCTQSEYGVAAGEGECTCHTVCTCDTVSEEESSERTSVVEGGVCTCNSVCTCDTVCTCDSEGGGGGGGTYYYPN